MSLLAGNTNDLYGPHDEQISAARTPANPSGVGTGGTQPQPMQFNPVDLVERNPVAQGIGKLASAQATNELGGQHLGIGGRLANESQGNEWAQLTWQGPQERYDSMKNHTGLANSPIDPVARLGTLAAMHDQGLATPMSPGRLIDGPDQTLPSMGVAEQRATEMKYAPRVADPMYAQGRPEPVRGSVQDVGHMPGARVVDSGQRPSMSLAQELAPQAPPVPIAPSSLVAPQPHTAQFDVPPAPSSTPMGAPTSNFNARSGFTPEALRQMAQYLNFPNAKAYR